MILDALCLTMPFAVRLTPLTGVVTLIGLVGLFSRNDASVRSSGVRSRSLLRDGGKVHSPLFAFVFAIVSPFLFSFIEFVDIWEFGDVRSVSMVAWELLEDAIRLRADVAGWLLATDATESCEPDKDAFW